MNVLTSILGSMCRYSDPIGKTQFARFTSTGLVFLGRRGDYHFDKVLRGDLHNYSSRLR